MNTRLSPNLLAASQALAADGSLGKVIAAVRARADDASTQRSALSALLGCVQKPGGSAGDDGEPGASEGGEVDAKAARAVAKAGGAAVAFDALVRHGTDSDIAHDAMQLLSTLATSADGAKALGVDEEELLDAIVSALALHPDDADLRAAACGVLAQARIPPQFLSQDSS